MKHVTTDLPAHEIEADAVVVGIYADGSLTQSAREIDEATAGSISRLREVNEIRGKANEVTSVLALAGVVAPHVVVTGLGERELICRSSAQSSAGAAARKLADRERASIAFLLDPEWTEELASSAVAGAMVGFEGQDLYRQEKSTHTPEQLSWPTSWKSAIPTGRILGDAMNLCRRLVNEPPHALYPESFATQVMDMAEGAGLEIEIWDEKRLAEEKCLALLAVGQGSSRPSRLAILRHQGADQGAPALGLVGKGVTFDSGGLSLKPSAGMLTMKCDMAGAAAVVGAMQAIGTLRLPVNVIGVIGMVENLISGDSFKLGDVVTARNGTTIEIHNTDAEGRLVLADALCVAVDLGVDKIVDLATLTGACVVALGIDICGVMTNDADWCSSVKSAAESAGEQVWELPMHADFAKHIKSKVADIKNVGNDRWGGAITAAKLLECFVSEKPWVHIDIAGPSFHDKPKAWVDAGASGVMVATLVELARNW